MTKKTLEILEKIGNTPATNEKTELMIKNKDNDLLKAIFKLAYDGNIVFGIKKIPSPLSGANQSDMTFEKALTTIHKELHKNKLRGHVASKLVAEILGALETDQERKWLERILKKDLKIGINKKSIEKVFEDLFESFGYMGAVPFDPKKFKKLLNEKDIIFIQEKMDGEFAFAHVKNNEISFISRANKLTSLPASIANKILDELNTENLDTDVILTGELLIDGFDRKTANGLITRITEIEKKGGSIKDVEKLESMSGIKYEDLIKKIYYVVWDRVDGLMCAKNGCADPYIERFIKLENMIKENCETIKIVPTMICFKANEILQNRLNIDKNKFLNKTFKIISGADASLIEKYSYAFFNKVLNNGGEGTLVKSGADGYKPGKPTYQIKKKMEFECELKIVGFKQGTKGTKYENSLGALVYESSDGKVKADPSGLKEDLRDKIWNNQNDYLNKIITVRCHKISKSKDNNHYSLLHPRFIKFRDDKTEADSYDEIAAIEDSIKNLK